MIRFAVGLRADEVPAPDDRRECRVEADAPIHADGDATTAAAAAAIGSVPEAGAPTAADAGFPRAFALVSPNAAPPGPGPGPGPGAARSAETHAAVSAVGITDGAPAPPDEAAAGCPVFLAGVPIDAAGARWLTATAGAAQSGNADAMLALWLALRPRFARWAAACLERTGAAGIRRDGEPWLLDDLLQEGYLVLLGVVADWPGGGRDGESDSAAATADSATGGASGRPAPTTTPSPFAPPAARPPGDAPETARAFHPWLLAVAPRRLFGALAALRERAGRPPGRGPQTVPLSDAALIADGTADAAAAAARLAALAATLDPLDGALLLAHVVHREPVVLAGRRLGLDRGAAYHRWRRLRARLRDGLAS